MVPSAEVMRPIDAIPKGQSPEVPPVALTIPLLMIMSPPLFNIAVEEFVVAVTFALMVMSPCNVPIHVLVDTAFTFALMLMPFFAPIAT